MSRPLGSTPITGASSLLRDGPPATAATVLDSSRFLPPGALPLAPPNPERGTMSALAFPTFPAKAADEGHAASVPDTAWPIDGHPPDSSQIHSNNLVLMSLLYSRHVNSGRLPRPHLTHQVRLFHIAHHDGLQPTQHVAV